MAPVLLLEQLALFLEALALGFAIGLGYDFYRAFCFYRAAPRLRPCSWGTASSGCWLPEPA